MFCICVQTYKILNRDCSTYPECPRRTNIRHKKMQSTAAQPNNSTAVSFGPISLHACALARG